MSKIIEWNGFLEMAVNSYPNEICGFLFAHKPYSSEEKWYVFFVRNAYTDPEYGWEPNKDSLKKIKALARKMGLVQLGNIHTHPYPQNQPYNEELMHEVIQPSTPEHCGRDDGKSDLYYAKKYRDIIRGIICVGKNAIYDIYFHDMYGNKIDVGVVLEKEDGIPPTAKAEGILPTIL